MAVLNPSEVAFFKRGGIIDIIAGSGVTIDKSDPNRPVISVSTTGGVNAETLNDEPGSFYLDRANHTGTQAISTVTDLQTELDNAANTANWNGITGDPSNPNAILTTLGATVAGINMFTAPNEDVQAANLGLAELAFKSKVAVVDVDATGTPSATTYYRGDGQWATPPNTTYTSMSAAEAQTGTSTTARTITAQVLAGAIPQHTPKAAAVADILEADATDLDTALVLANAIKATVNSLLAALRTAGLLTT